MTSANSVVLPSEVGSWFVDLRVGGRNDRFAPLSKVAVEIHGKGARGALGLLRRSMDRGDVVEGVDAIKICAEHNAPHKLKAREEWYINRTAYLQLALTWTKRADGSVDEVASNLRRALIDFFLNGMALARSDELETRPALQMVAEEVDRRIHEKLLPLFDSHREIISRIDDLSREVVHRKTPTIETKRLQTLAVIKQGGLCPCCFRTRLFSESGEVIEQGEFDHYGLRSEASLTDVWLICRPCHKRLSGRGRQRERDRDHSKFVAFTERVEVMAQDAAAKRPKTPKRRAPHRPRDCRGQGTLF